MTRHEREWRVRVLLALCCCLCLVLAPALAQARAGSSYGSRPSSLGSRGLRSFDYNSAQPLPRSVPQAQPGYGAGMPGPGVGGSFVQRHPFLTGLAGGIFGSWLFGHAAYAAGGGGAGSFFGTLIWLAIIVGLVWFGFRLFRARAPAAWPAGGGGAARSAGAAANPARRFRGRDVNLSDADLQAFERLHAAIQYAWSAADMGRLRQLMTPDMLAHFSQELARNNSRGVRNIVSNVQLLNGELTEAWDEGDRQYASALMRWRAIDYVQRLGAAPGDTSVVVNGDPRRPIDAEEMWTFVHRPGGGWLLSAIQQV